MMTTITTVETNHHDHFVGERRLQNKRVLVPIELFTTKYWQQFGGEFKGGGARDVPAQFNFVFDFMQFEGKWPNNRLGLAPPPNLGNPGSATVFC